ncbi:MAG: hypothetical protein KJP00_00125, partial [Bacteroidia bacterium]|nr:hypothetical protein [Bacteroidia bacterium]
MENLQFQYPSYYLIFCIIGGLFLAGLLYYKADFFREQSKKLNWSLGTLRFFGVGLIGILLLSPILKRLFTETKSPIIVIAQDNSESIQSSMSSEQIVGYAESINTLADDLNDVYDVKLLRFGEMIEESSSFNYTDKVTNISNVFDHIYDNYSDQNLGAVILASDGIFNEGNNPIYSGTKIHVPIYSIALGDTTSKRDIKIRRVFHNQIAYLEDQFNVEIDISAFNATAQRPILSIAKFENGQFKKILEESILINGNDFFTTLTVPLLAESPGVSRYRVSVGAIRDEISLSNNTQEFFVDILDARQKILILANAPHPDLSALKSALETNKNYEIEVKYAKDPPTSWAEYDLTILHQLPSRKDPVNNVIAQINQRKIPTLFIVGSQSDLNAISRIQSIVDITGDGRNFNEVSAKVEDNFNLFTLDEALKNALPTFAPLTAPFGEFIADATGKVLLYQKIGKVDTKYPLMIFGEENDTKMAVLNAEGVWKWKLYDFLQHQNHDLFNNMIRKTAQYLTVKEDKRRFQISLPKKIFKENERISMDAILYNQSYELINDPEVSMTIRDGEGNDYPFIFTKKDRSYFVNAGFFPIGNYSFLGKTNHSGQALEYSGQFSVQPIQKEQFETTADHGLLAQISEQFGGELVYPEMINQLPSKINASGNV